MKKKKLETEYENPIFQLQDLGYRIFAKYDTVTNDFPRLENWALDPNFDDYYLSGKKGICEVHHSYDNIYMLYIFSLKSGNSILDKLKSENVVIDYDVTDAEVVLTFDMKDIDAVDAYCNFLKAGYTTSPTDIKNLPGTYDIPDVKSEEFTNIGKELKIPISKYKKIYIEFITSKTTQKNNLLNKLSASEIPAKNFIYYNGLWDDFIEYIKNNGG